MSEMRRLEKTHPGMFKMKHTHAIRHWVVPMLLMLAVTCSQCVCQSTRRDATPSAQPTTQTPAPAVPLGQRETAPTIPQSVDVADLDLDELKILHAVLAEQFDPCGQAMSFLDSLKQKDCCERALQMASHTVELVAKGFSKRQIVRELTRELARLTTRVDIDLSQAPVTGDPGAKHVIVEFTDFQCPYCKMAAEPLKELAEHYGAALYVKHLPLDHHPYSRAAALASIAAQAQGKFWEVYTLFFKNQDRLDDAVIRELVEAAGVDMRRYDKAFKKTATQKHLEKDIAEADTLMLEGTPTFFMNGFMMELDEIQARLESDE